MPESNLEMLNIINEYINISDLLSSVIGTIVGAAIAWYFAKRESIKEDKEEKINLIFKLKEQRLGHEHTSARLETQKLFRDFYKQCLPGDLSSSQFSEFCNGLHSSRRNSLFSVFSFFSHLWLSIKYERVDRDITVDLFVEDFLLWYHMWFDKCIPSDWGSRESLDEFNNWIRSEVLSNKDYIMIRDTAHKYLLETKDKLLAEKAIKAP